MKYLLVIFCLLFTSVGWSEDISIDYLVVRDGLYYEKFTDVPFTGEVTGTQIGKISKGKREGEWLSYRVNGQLWVKENYKEINDQRRAQLQQELMREDEDARKQMSRSRNPIQAEPVRKYPYTNISGYYPGPPSTRWIEDGTTEPKKVYKYY